MDEWIENMWTIEYYLAFRKKGIFSYAMTWMNLEDGQMRMIGIIWGI